MKKEEREEKEKATQVYATLGISLICVLIGIPLWWKTTQVYRVQLPYTEIEALTDSKVKYTVNIRIINFDFDFKEKSQLLQILKKNLNQNNASVILSEHILSFRPATNEEETILKNSQSVKELDFILGKKLFSSNSEYQVFLLPKAHIFKDQVPHVGQYKATVICNTGVQRLSESLTMIFQNVLTRHSPLERLYEASAGRKQLKPDKASMRSLRFHTDYDITFTLFSPQPDIIDARWDMKEGVRLYLKPLLDQMRDFVNITVKSQILFYPSFYVRPYRNPETKENFLNLQELPHMINPLETKLGFQASNNPNLNFIVYVPTRDQTPLFIRNENGERDPTNSFLSPRWGGIHIYNAESPGPNDTLPKKVNIDLHTIMEVFITQIRMLLNLEVQTQDSIFTPAGIGGATEWEVAGWLRTSAIENVVTSTSTLQSLAKLLGEISNIVIKDAIGQEVQIAVSCIKDSLKLLAAGKDKEAFFASKKAVISSEKAFFDQSLLELLYFPEDQKFAIYIPLFLPVSIPVIISTIHSLKWIKRKWSSKKTKTE